MEKINKNSADRDRTKGEPDTISTKKDDTKQASIQTRNHDTKKTET